MKKANKWIALVPALLLTYSAYGATSLRSPWDGRVVQLTDASYACPATVHLSRDLTTNGFYSDSKSSVIDPAKWKAYAQGLIDNSLFENRTGIPQDTPNGRPAAEQISWAQIWVSRFHDPALAKILSEASSLSYMYLGGLPPGAHK